MRFKWMALTAGAFMASVPSVAASEPQTASSPILGRWKLDTGSMTIPVDARPASVTVEFADAGAGMWSTTFIITEKNGNARHINSYERLDGKAVTISGDQSEADSVAMVSPAPSTLVMGLSKSGYLGSVRTYSVSSDGSEMIESAARIGEDGKPTVRRFRWVR